MFRPARTNPRYHDAQFARQTSTLIPAEVRLLSSCHTIQSSVDAAAAYEGGLPDPVNRIGGACTACLLQLLYAADQQQRNKTHYQNPPLSFQKLLLELRSLLLDKGFDQIPQLTSSRPLELQKTPFDLGGHRGTKRALLVGINYDGQMNALSGCHNDVYKVKHYLHTVQGFSDKHTVMLLDDGHHIEPSRHEIIRALQLLVQDSKPGDAVYFHYSGHGGLLFPEANDFKAKTKGYDETIYPVDHAYAGQIHDFSLFRHFVQPMRDGVTVTVVMDCCHCGSVLELPYSFQPTSSGTIQMRESLDALANIAFLHVLMGNLLPAGFANLAEHLQSTTGVSLGDYQGIGLALEDHQGTNGANDLIKGGSFEDMVSDKADQTDEKYPVNGYESDDNNTTADCDCFGGGILSFLFSLFGNSGGRNDLNNDDYD